MVEISQELYAELLTAQDKLDRLEAAGVDNWIGYDDALFSANGDGETHQQVAKRLATEAKNGTLA